ncbi:MAG: hypothetical protein ACOC1F_06895, partial [Myxococcota bacterium]
MAVVWIFRALESIEGQGDRLAAERYELGGSRWEDRAQYVAGQDSPARSGKGMHHVGEEDPIEPGRTVGSTHQYSSR